VQIGHLVLATTNCRPAQSIDNVERCCNHPIAKGGNVKVENKRVLSRTGARELTPEEVAQISGGLLNTNVISVNPITGQRDGDG
jgi:hypothetical protein